MNIITIYLYLETEYEWIRMNMNMLWIRKKIYNIKEYFVSTIFYILYIYITIIFFEFKTLSYTADPEKLKAFYKTYHECQKELNLSACEYYIYIIIILIVRYN